MRFKDFYTPSTLRSVGLRFLLATGLVISAAACATFRSGSTGQGSVAYKVKVERGDTLASIANQFDTDWRKIVQDNNLGPNRQLRVGQVIIVRPGPAGLAAAEKSTVGATVFGASEEVTAPAAADVPAGQVGAPTAAWQEEDLKAPPTKLPQDTKDKKATGKSPKKGQGLLFGTPNGDEAGNVTFKWPVASTSVSSRFGPRWGRFHNGIDIRANRGAPIFPSQDGRVVFAGRRRGYGHTMIIDHGHYRTLYGHCHKLLKKRGDWVDSGDTVAQVGASGNARGIHLHFEIQTSAGRPIDPEPMLEKPLLSNTDFFDLGRSLTAEMILALAE